MQAVERFRKQPVAAVQEKETGHFVSKESRVEVAQELKRSHFTLGSDKVDFRSKNEINQQEQNWNIDQTKSKFGQIIKQSHVQIGENSKFTDSTTHSSDFNVKSVDLARVSAAQETKKDLRKSHFNLGNSQGADTFTTTNQERFKNSSLNMNPGDLRNKPSDQAIGSSIYYGNQKPNYQSSAKEYLVTHDLAQSYKNMQQQHEQGVSVRKHNFQLGYQNSGAAESEYQNFAQNESRSKSMQGPVFRTADVKRSNIEIGSKFSNNDYTSMSLMSLNQCSQASTTQRDEKFNPAEVAAKTQQDLRRSHFQIGTAPMILESSAKGAFKNVDVDPTSQKEKQMIQSKMQKGNFQIGDTQNRSMQHSTTYKQSIANENKPLLDSSNTQDQRKHLHGSINLGSHINEFISENKSKFHGLMGEKDNAYQHMIDKNRSPHFKFGDGQSKELQSVMRSQYDYKGNPVEIRQTLDENTKADLKQHHFQMGSHGSDYQTSALKPTGDQANQGQYKIEAKSLLKNSGQRIFGGNSSPQKAGSDYKTTNQAFIKWIQPAPTQIALSMGGLAKP